MDNPMPHAGDIHPPAGSLATVSDAEQPSLRARSPFSEGELDLEEDVRIQLIVNHGPEPFPGRAITPPHGGKKLSQRLS